MSGLTAHTFPGPNPHGSDRPHAGDRPRIRERGRLPQGDRCLAGDVQCTVHGRRSLRDDLWSQVGQSALVLVLEVGEGVDFGTVGPGLRLCNALLAHLDVIPPLLMVDVGLIACMTLHRGSP